MTYKQMAQQSVKEGLESVGNLRMALDSLYTDIQQIPSIKGILNMDVLRTAAEKVADAENALKILRMDLEGKGK